jgi:hypothetical protein
MRICTVIAIALLLASPGAGQHAVGTTSIFADYLNVQPPEGFLHIQGLDFNASMGFSYLSSSQFGSVGTGYYMGHFSLRLSPTMTVRWDVGLLSDIAGDYGDQQPRLFLPNVDLTYRPTDRMTFRIQYRQYDRSTYNLYRGY